MPLVYNYKQWHIEIFTNKSIDLTRHTYIVRSKNPF